MYTSYIPMLCSHSTRKTAECNFFFCISANGIGRNRYVKYSQVKCLKRYVIDLYVISVQRRKAKKNHHDIGIIDIKNDLAKFFKFKKLYWQNVK